MIGDKPVKVYGAEGPRKHADLGEELKFVSGKLKEIFKTFRPAGEAVPIAVLVNASGDTMLILDHWASKTKEDIGKMLAEVAKQRKAEAILLAADSWYVEAAEVEDADSIRPKDHSGRREALVLTVVMPDGECSLEFHPYHMDGKTIVWEEVAAEDKPLAVKQSIIPAWGDCGGGRGEARESVN